MNPIRLGARNVRLHHLTASTMLDAPSAQTLLANPSPHYGLPSLERKSHAANA